MIDIRTASKIFLDFIYDNDILPKSIGALLKTNKSQWDIRQICEILANKENYQTANGERFETMIYSGKKLYSDQKLIYEIYKNRDCWKDLDESILNWLDKSKTLLEMIIEKLNEFFHDVSQDIGLDTVNTALGEIIDKCPKEFEKENYLGKIKEQPIRKNNNQDNIYYAKALNRIPKWAQSKTQYNFKIIWSYFKVEAINGAENVTIALMKELCLKNGMDELHFKNHYRSLSTDSGNADGKVFEDDGNNVWIWKEVKEKLMQYRESFIKNEIK